jgi:huntingtin
MKESELFSPIKIVIGLSRTPVLNSFARTPPIVWKMGWIPTPSGEPKTKLPPLPIDLMLDKEVLREFVNRISMIGRSFYIVLCYQQFYKWI